MTRDYYSRRILISGVRSERVTERLLRGSLRTGSESFLPETDPRNATGRTHTSHQTVRQSRFDVVAPADGFTSISVIVMSLSTCLQPSLVEQ